MDEKLKQVKDIIDKLDLPPLEKSIATMMVAMGANPTEFLMVAKAHLDTLKAEREHPRLPMPKDYTETERVLHEMLVENTGVHPLDSGSAYGRHWERNREVEDFRKLPVVDVTVWKDGSIEATVNVFHYLRTFLQRDKTCEALESMLYAMSEEPEYRRMSWFRVMEEFADRLVELGWRASRSWNSYNWDNLLSQVIAGVNVWKEEDADGYPAEEYVILQIHNGCDVRGGYTKPRVFRLVEEEPGDFFFMMDELEACCDCFHASTNDCGYHWYVSDGSEGSLPEEWKPVPKNENPENWEYLLKCEKCGKEVRFYSPIEEYP
jgi:hypothetical protein